MNPKSLRLLVFALLLGLTSIAANAAAPAVTVPKADLELLAGSYVNVEFGYAFDLALQDDRLKLTIKEGPRFENVRLIPASPVRFRVEWEGPAPGLQLAFQLPAWGGRAESLTVLQANGLIAVMKRVN